MTTRWVRCRQGDVTIYLNMANAVQVRPNPDRTCSISFMKGEGEHWVHVNETAESVVDRSGTFQ